jgi:hypothetical protein
MGAFSMHGRDKEGMKNFGRKHNLKRSVGKARHRWKDNIKMYSKDTGCEGVDSIQLAQDRVH